MDSDESKSLEPQGPDYVASTAKAFLGAVPFVGSLLVELAGTIVPNQRMDRIADFAGELEARLSVLEQDFVRAQLSDPQFTDLMEEGLNQAARAVSAERRAQIAELVSRSLTPEDITFSESKHLLRILGELNDVEVIRLGSYQYPVLGGGSGQRYRAKHEGVLARVLANYYSPQRDQDKAALQESYDLHLERLGLLRGRFAVDSRTKIPEFDTRTGAQKVRGYELTRLGRLMCRQVGILEEEHG